MLSNNQQTLLKLLATVAWADGRISKDETEVLEVILDSFGADKEEAQQIRAWAMTPRGLGDVDVSMLTTSDAELALSQAVLITFIDGEQTAGEFALLNELASRLKLLPSDAKAILDQATLRARALLPLLHS